MSFVVENPPLVLVRWYGSQFKWDYKPQPLKCESVGFIIHQDDESITVASHRRAGKSDETARAFQMACIRRTQIESIIEFKEGETYDPDQSG